MSQALGPGQISAAFGKVETGELFAYLTILDAASGQKVAKNCASDRRGKFEPKAIFLNDPPDTKRYKLVQLFWLEDIFAMNSAIRFFISSGDTSSMCVINVQ